MTTEKNLQQGESGMTSQDTEPSTEELVPEAIRSLLVKVYVATKGKPMFGRVKAAAHPSLIQATRYFEVEWPPEMEGLLWKFYADLILLNYLSSKRVKIALTPKGKAYAEQLVNQSRGNTA